MALWSHAVTNSQVAVGQQLAANLHNDLWNWNLSRPCNHSRTHSMMMMTRMMMDHDDDDPVTRTHVSSACTASRDWQAP